MTDELPAQARTTVRVLGWRERTRRALDVRARLAGLVFLGLVLGVWEWAGRRAANYVFAPPSEVISALPAMIRDGTLLHAVATSATDFAIGFGLAALVGIALGFAMGSSRAVGRVLNPYVSALYVVPVVALIPLIEIWLGFGREARVVVIFLFSVFEILLSAYGGVRGVEPMLLDVARSFGAGRAQVLRRLILPGSLPYVLVGLRLGASRGIKGMITAQLIFSLSGLGALLGVYRSQYQTAPMLVVVMTIALMGVAVSGAIQLVERRLLRWRPPVGSHHTRQRER